MSMGKKAHLISKQGLPYYAKFTPWKKRAARGHERAAQKRDWQRETTPERPATAPRGAEAGEA